MLPKKKKSYRRKREENKKRRAIKRALETPEEREKRLQTDRLKRAVKRAFETEEQVKTKQEELRTEREVEGEREKKNAVLITLALLIDQVVKQAEEEKKKSLYEDFLIYKTRQDCRQSPRLFLQRLNGFSPNYVSQSKISVSTQSKVLRKVAIKKAKNVLRKKAMLTSGKKRERNKRAHLKAAKARAAWTDEQRAFYKEKQRANYNSYRLKKQNQEYYERSRKLAITLAELRNELVMQKKFNKTRPVSKLSPQLSLQSKNGFSSNSISQADFGVSPYMQYWYPENCINILTDDVIVKYPELFNAFSNHHCISTASEITTSINVSTPNIKKEIVPSVELGNSRSASKPATNISTIKIKEEPTSDLHCSASNSSPGSENSIPNGVFNNIKEESTSELYNSSTYLLTNAVENYYSEVYSEPVSDQNMNNNNNIQNLYIVDGNVMCISSVSVQEPTEMITPD